jgi:protein-disulfide isomerase
MKIIRILSPLLACALLLTVTVTVTVAGAAIPDAQDVALITRDGVRQILANPGTEAVGAHKPDVVIVEYFDYNCPYCKKLVPALKQLLAQDPKVGLVYKDWPILGPVSEYAAASALAA